MKCSQLQYVHGLSPEHTKTELAEFHWDHMCKQPSVATKNSTVIALVSTLSNSQSDSITYCCGDKTLLFWEVQIPKIYCLYSVYAYTVVYTVATHYFGNCRRSLISSASAYATASVCDTELYTV